MRQDVRDDQYTGKSPCRGCEREYEDKNECLDGCPAMAIYRDNIKLEMKLEDELKEPQKMNIDKLRTILVEELEALRKGTTTPDIANAVGNVSGKIMATVKLEMEYCKMVGKTPEIDFITIDKKKLIDKK